MTIPTTPLVYQQQFELTKADTDTSITLWGWRHNGVDSGPVFETRDAAFTDAAKH